jgi:hypothetical protein
MPRSRPGRGSAQLCRQLSEFVAAPSAKHLRASFSEPRLSSFPLPPDWTRKREFDRDATVAIMRAQPYGELFMWKRCSLLSFRGLSWPRDPYPWQRCYPTAQGRSSLDVFPSRACSSQTRRHASTAPPFLGFTCTTGLPRSCTGSSKYQRPAK